MEAKGEDISMDSSAMDVEDEAEEEALAADELAPVVATPTKAEPVVEAPKPATPAKTETPVKAEPAKEATPVKAAAPVTPVKAATPVKAVTPVKAATPAKAEEAATTNGADKEEVAAETETPAADAPAETPAKGVKRKRNDDEPFVVVEDEPDIDESLLCLDWHNSDISLKIEKASLMIAEPLHKDGWGFVW